MALLDFCLNQVMQKIWQSRLRMLWENPQLCLQMGAAGRQKAIREYSPDVYYERLLTVYSCAIEMCQSATAQPTSPALHAYPKYVPDENRQC